VFDIIKLGSHDMFLADIVAITVDEKYINEQGKLCLSKANLAAFSHGQYFELGKRIGTFGYSVRKKKTYNNKQR
jgi:flavin reductase (DIM6/NTAB) family NADH-FMN oxidoreductase RutF